MTATRPNPADILAGKVTPTAKAGGHFPAIPNFKVDGQKIVGVYLGREEFPVPGDKAGETRMAVSHVWELAAATDGLDYTLSKKIVQAKLGDRVSISGATLERSPLLIDANRGKLMAVTYVGSAPSKFRTETKVFEVELYD